MQVSLIPELEHALPLAVKRTRCPPTSQHPISIAFYPVLFLLLL